MYQLKCISLKTGAEIAMPKRTILCLGNFDGVHLAHRELLGSALAWRETLGVDASVGVFCFRAHRFDSHSRYCSFPCCQLRIP